MIIGNLTIIEETFSFFVMVRDICKMKRMQRNID